MTINNVLSKTTLLVAALLLALPLAAWADEPDEELQINEVLVIFTDPAHGDVDTLTITGTFAREDDWELVVTLGEFPDALAILSTPTATEIVSPTTPAPSVSPCT